MLTDGNLVAQSFHLRNQVLFHVKVYWATPSTRTLRLSAECTISGVGFPKPGSENFVSADVLIETDDMFAHSLIHPPP